MIKMCQRILNLKSVVSARLGALSKHLSWTWSVADATKHFHRPPPLAQGWEGWVTEIVLYSTSHF